MVLAIVIVHVGSEQFIYWVLLAQGPTPTADCSGIRMARRQLQQQ